MRYDSGHGGGGLVGGGTVRADFFFSTVNEKIVGVYDTFLCQALDSYVRGKCAVLYCIDLLLHSSDICSRGEDGDGGVFHIPHAWAR